MNFLAIRIYGSDEADASVRLTKEFSECDPLFRADVLQIALVQLQEEYEAAVAAAFPKAAAMTTDEVVSHIVTTYCVEEGGAKMVHGVRDESGAIYRRFTSQGLAAMLDIVDAMNDAGFADELEQVAGMREGCDLIWTKRVSEAK